MAFKMNSSMGKKVTPLRQDNKYLGAQKEAEDIIKKRKSLKKFNEFEMGVEKAAATDSIMASRPKNAQLYTKKEKERMGNKAANETRKVNKVTTTVERGSKMDPKTGPTDTYKRKPASPTPQLKAKVKIKVAAKKAPAKMKKC
jgi:hypothetical protein